MFNGLARALTFARRWKGPPKGIVEEEVEIRRSDGVVPGSLFRPSDPHRPLPGWVVLHGITRPGRNHPTLLRFARALAGSGNVVLVPEIPEWRELYLALDAARDTLQASVLHLDARAEVGQGRVGAMGFSFGVPQVLVAAADPQLRGHLKAVAGFGGYCDLHRTIRFLFSGEHEWRGVTYRDIPDPYGRWVLGGNFLPEVPGFGDAADVAEALLALARAAGDLQVASWEAHFDGLKEELMGRIHPERRAIFAAFAPPSDRLPPPEVTERLAPSLATITRESSPFSEAGPFLERISLPVRLIHGRDDRLIPFSESLRLAELFPPSADVRVHITKLFAHSQRDRRRRLYRELRERLNFLWIMTELQSLL